MNASRIVYTAGILAVAVDVWNNYGLPHLPGYGTTMDPDKYRIPVPSGGFLDDGSSAPLAAHFYLIIGAVLILLSFFVFTAEAPARI